MRSNERKRQGNQSVKNRLRTLEKKFLSLVDAGKPDDAQTAFRSVSAALDKAAKTGVIHANTAYRKKSRLNLRLNSAKA
jgi:small subunit ribosomal protein S20